VAARDGRQSRDGRLQAGRSLRTKEDEKTVYTAELAPPAKEIHLRGEGTPEETKKSPGGNVDEFESASGL